MLIIYIFYDSKLDNAEYHVVYMNALYIYQNVYKENFITDFPLTHHILHSL